VSCTNWFPFKTVQNFKFFLILHFSNSHNKKIKQFKNKIKKINKNYCILVRMIQLITIQETIKIIHLQKLTFRPFLILASIEKRIACFSSHYHCLSLAASKATTRGPSGHCSLSALQEKFHLCIHFLGLAKPQSQFPHSCVCEPFIYSQD
jgi:hypothetical protein